MYNVYFKKDVKVEGKTYKAGTVAVVDKEDYEMFWRGRVIEPLGLDEEPIEQETQGSPIMSPEDRQAMNAIIDTMFDEFDWDGVNKVFKTLDMQWIDPDQPKEPKRPPIGVIQARVREMVEEAFEHIADGKTTDFEISSGGFTVSAWLDSDNDIAISITLTPITFTAYLNEEPIDMDEPSDME